MKRHNQTTGIRAWAGEDLIDLQAEPLKAIDAFFAEYDPCIIKGCEVTTAGGKYNVAPGIVSLEGKDHTGQSVQMVVPFAGVNDVVLPLYLTLANTANTRPYLDGEVKPVSYSYYAAPATVAPPAGIDFLEITTEGAARFVDVIQDSEHRFMSEQLIAFILDKLMADAPADGQVYGRRNNNWTTVDSFMVGEIRRFFLQQPFTDPKYLPADGSMVEPTDYPDLALTANFTHNAAVTIQASFTIKALYYSHDKYFAIGIVGTATNLYSSPNGTTWTQKSTRASYQARAAFFAKNCDDIVCLTVGAAATGVVATFSSSDGGDNWVNGTTNIPNLTQGSNTQANYESKVHCFDFVNNNFMAVVIQFAGSVQNNPTQWTEIYNSYIYESTTGIGNTYIGRIILNGESILAASFGDGMLFCNTMTHIEAETQSPLPYPPNSLYRSLDTVQFTQISKTSSQPIPVKIIKVQSRLISTYNARWISDDGGLTWLAKSGGGNLMAAIGSTILSYNGSTAMISTDGGNSWANQANNAPFTPAHLIAGNSFLIGENGARVSMPATTVYLPNIPSTATEKAYIKVLK